MKTFEVDRNAREGVQVGAEGSPATVSTPSLPGVDVRSEQQQLAAELRREQLGKLHTTGSTPITAQQKSAIAAAARLVASTVKSA